MYSVKEIFYTLQGEGAHAGRAAVFCRFAGCNLWSGREADRASAMCRFCDTDFADTNGPGGGKFASAEELAAAVEGQWLKPVPETGLVKGHDFSRAVSAQEKYGALAPPAIRSNPIEPFLNPAPAGAVLKATADPSTPPLARSASVSAQDDSAEGAEKDSGRGGRFVVCTGGEPLLQMDELLIDALHAYGFEIAVETNGTIAAPPGLDWICVSPKAGTELKQRTGDELKLVYPQPGTEPGAFESLAFRHFFLQPMDGPFRDDNTQAALRYCLDHPRWRLSLQTHKLLGIP